MHHDSAGKLAYLIVLIQGIAISSMAILVGYVSKTEPIGNIIFVRAMIISIALFFVCRTEIPELFKRTNWAVWVRGIFGALSVACLFWNLSRTSPSIAATLGAASSVFVLLFSFLFLKERPALLGWIGILLVLACSVLLKTTSLDGIGWDVVAIGLSGAALGGASLVSLNLTHKNVSNSLIVWLCTLLMIPISLFLDFDVDRLMDHAIFYIIMIALLSALSQICITYVYRNMRPIKAMVLTRSAIIITILMEINFLGRAFDWTTLLLIAGLIAGVILTNLKILHKKSSSVEE